MPIIIKRSTIHGKGVFANKNFKKGEIVFRWDSLLNDLNETEVKSPISFLNHSCNPNLTDKDGENVALRDIKKSEEITIDYVKENVPFLSLKCNCNGKNCKKEIKGGLIG